METSTSIVLSLEIGNSFVSNVLSLGELFMELQSLLQ